jgi:hypothetical protein
VRFRRLISVAAVGVLAATGVAVLSTGPAGAGNPLEWPVDAQVKAKGDSAYSGIEIFGDAQPGQVRSVFALPGELALFRVKIQNTKFQNNRINVYFDGFGGGQIRVLEGKTDISSEFKNGNFVRRLGPREAIVLKVKVRPDGPGAGALIHAESLKFSGEADHVEVEAFNELEG